jgi:hypothetical protein
MGTNITDAIKVQQKEAVRQTDVLDYPHVYTKKGLNLPALPEIQSLPLQK